MKKIQVIILTMFIIGLQVLFTPAVVSCFAEEAEADTEIKVIDINNMPPEIKELDGKRFGVQTGTTFDEDVGMWFPNAKIEYYNTIPDLTIALQTGKIDAFPADVVTLEMLKNEGAELKVLPPYMDYYECGFIFTKTEEGGHIRDEMDEWITEAKESGLLDEMLNKWIFGAEEEKTMPDYKSLPAKNGTLVFATEAAYPPFNYMREGEIVGFEVEIATRFCEKAGYALDIKAMNFDAIFPALKSKKIDFGASGIAITEERKESINFSQPYYSSGTKIVVGNADDNGMTWWGKIVSSFKKTFIREQRWKLFAEGIFNTLLITVMSIITGTALGFFVFMICRKGNRFANAVTRIAMHLVQGMPMVVLLMILYYVIFGKVSINGIVVAIIGFMLTFGSGVYGLLSIGVGSVDRGQYEAAYALGHSERHTFYRIILPQALPLILPAYRGEIVGLLKATAIVGYVAVADLTRMGDLVRSRTYEAFFPLIAVAIIYFILEDLFNFLIGRLERKMDPKRRTRKEILKGVKTDDKNRAS